MKKYEYYFDYIDETEFKKIERSVKKYNMLAYKKLYFEYYEDMKSGNFKGEIIFKSKDSVSYELPLSTDSMFAKIYGQIKLYYTVFSEEKKIILEKIEPKEMLLEYHAKEPATYKGVMVPSSNAKKDMFKINLLDMLNK